MIKASEFTSAELAEMVHPESYYQIENWCNTLEEYTFKTRTFPMTFDEAKALCGVHEAITLLQQVELQEMNNPHIYRNADWIQGAKMPPGILEKFISEEEKVHLDSLEAKLDDAIKEMGGCAFIRLSTRSPKDAALRTTKMRNIIKEIVEAEENIDNLSDEEKDIRNMCAFTIACQRALKVESGKEAMLLLMMSQRATHDIGLKRLHLQEEQFEMNVVAREWADIPTIWEFRCLIYNNEITVITHYYENCYVKEIVDREDEIVSRIRAKFDEINKKVPISNYTIDFCVDPNSDKVWLIEINNPPPIAGVSFMDYKNEEDRKVIENGPFVFKINRKPLKDPYKSVEPILVRYMKHLRGNLDKVPNIGKHPGISCSHCGMSPIIGERFCCIECGGGVYDMDSPDLLQEGIEHDPTVTNMCCFCFCERVHNQDHHYIVHIDENIICESQYGLVVKKLPSSPAPIAEEKSPEEGNSWCSIL